MRPAERIEAAGATLGEGMAIRRALPTRRRRLVGAWCFLDHFGPAEVAHGQGMRVGPHPHMGLQTVTWLVSGEVLHRDSLGSLQKIEPGALNLMTAGRGISHSEESPLPRSAKLHGVQFWIALPASARHGAPAFTHHPRVPAVRHGGLRVSVLAGEWLGERSPARVYSDLMGADVVAPAGADAVLPLREDYEHGAIVLDGEAQVGDERLAPGTLLYLGCGRPEVSLRTGASGARLIVVGGVPFEEPVLMWWNFVGRDQEEITRACRQWNDAQARFGEVRGYDGPRLLAPLPPWAGEGDADAVAPYP